MADETAPTVNSTETTAPAEAAPVAEVSALGGAGEEAPASAGAAEGKDAAEANAGDAAEAGKEGEGEAKAGPPDAYDLAMPEGVSIDKASLDAAAPVFRELGLSNEQAQKLVPVAADFAKRIQDGLNQQILTQVAADRKNWLETAKADTEIGGAEWDKSLATAAKGLDQLGFPKGSPLRNLLDESGLGNHPDMIRAWVKVGKAIGEDGDFVRADHTAPGKKSDRELFYPEITSGQK